MPPLSGPLYDRLGRPLRDLRISVTDRCNFRCGYCMPREAFGHDHAFLPQRSLLTFEEIRRVAGIFVKLGVTKVRLTGGEPLLRRGLDTLIRELATLRTPEGAPVELAMTTNGVLLERMADRLREAGLHRVTVSLDALDPARFQAMADTDVDVKQVLRGIDAAMDAGLGPVKVNMVVQKGRNDDQILPMVRYFRHRPVTLRFIEYMDVGQTNGWNLREVLSWQDIRALIHQAHPLEPLDRHDPAATALRWRFADGHGELGFIASVTQAFCGDCTRLRLSTEGMLYTCLFAHRGYDLRALVREQALPDEAVAAHLSGLWRARQDRYSELRHQHVPAHHAPAAPTSSTGSTGSTGSRIEMSYIGG